MASLCLWILWTNAVGFFQSGAAVAWLTGLATAALYWATFTLSRSTNTQLMLDGPFLRVDLALHPSAKGTLLPYYEVHTAQDTRILSSPKAPEESARYLYLNVTNEQRRPIGVAGKIEIVVQIRIRRNHQLHNNTDLILQRSVRINALGTDQALSIPIFDITNVSTYSASIDQLNYCDIFGRPRMAGWGSNAIVHSKQGAFHATEKLFDPRKGEYTDGPSR